MITPEISEYRFIVWSRPSTKEYETVEIKRAIPGEDRWKITYNGHSTWDTEEKAFVHEPMPSSRDEDYYKFTRFTREKAFETVKEAINHILKESINNILKIMEEQNVRTERRTKRTTRVSRNKN